MKPDIEQYMHHLESLDLPEVEKAALIEVVCSITERFVDLAFGCDPTQQAMSITTDHNKKAFQDSANALEFKSHSKN